MVKELFLACIQRMHRVRGQNPCINEAMDTKVFESFCYIRKLNFLDGPISGLQLKSDAEVKVEY